MDGTIVAVKRAILTPDLKKHSKEFNTELGLLSRLNHTHLLDLLGYSEEGGERLLVYEFMANGSLYQHLHNAERERKEQLDWVCRVTIAVQAARGIEYLHGYACPPVIHHDHDIKSSNILIDEEHNALVTLILGSSRMHKKSSQRYGNRSMSETEGGDVEDQRMEIRAPSWITFPSVASSQRRKSSLSDSDPDGKNLEMRNAGNGNGVGENGLMGSVVEEISPASPRQQLYLHHNF